jgi:dipeptidase E
LPPERARRAGRTPTILAMGGGGFTMEPDNPALDDFVLSLAAGGTLAAGGSVAAGGRAAGRDPRVCLLPTAGGDSEAQIHRYYSTFSDRPCEPTHVSLFRLGDNPVPLREHLLAQDIIYVGGGSMVNLLAIWHAQGLPAILREAWQRGIVLAGLSAGSMCWFEYGITKSVGHPAVARGLGFLPGSNSVHYDGEPERRPVFLEAVGSGAIPGGWGADDGAALLFRGARMCEAVASGPHARAFHVARTAEGVVEDPIEPRQLPRPPKETLETELAIGELRGLNLARRAADRRGPRRG